MIVLSIICRLGLPPPLSLNASSRRSIATHDRLIANLKPGMHDQVREAFAKDRLLRHFHDA
ncbi:MAG: hypothetical protein H0W74_12590 [Sphingosinicella sp.]|nr:hypothetical protein [Sphingosinicella sp.]